MADKNQNQGGDIEKANGNTQLAERNPTDVATYRILNRSEEEITKAMEVFEHNLRGQKLTELNLPRVKVPPQGITIWSVPSAEGDIHIEDLTGILVEYTTPRAYWDKPLDPNVVTPPVCSSPDGMMGSFIRTGPEGPGGPCHLCPLSKFGSDPRPESNGQACKEKRMLFLLGPDSILPRVVQAPSTSIRNIFDYAMQLSDAETLFQNVYTQLTLEKISAGGVEYGKVVLKNVGPVPEEAHRAVESYRAGLSNILSTQQVEVQPDIETPLGQTQQDEGEAQDDGAQDDGSQQGNGQAENQPETAAAGAGPGE